MNKYSVVCFFAREHGLNGLEALVKSDKYEPTFIFTHRKKTIAEDTLKANREDYIDYLRIARENNIPLLSVDCKEDAKAMNNIINELDIDLLASISWRRLIPKEHLNLPKYGGVNIHRGKLPEYAGGGPIKKALLNQEREIYNTAHLLEEEIDTGEIINSYKHPVNYNPKMSLEENQLRLIKEITPSFGYLLIDSLNQMVKKKE